MLSLLIALFAGAVTGTAIGFIVNAGFGIFIGLFIATAAFILLTRYFSKKLQAVFLAANNDLQKQRPERAVAVLKEGYKLKNFVILGKAQIDSQIGIILYTQKKFGEAYKYLQNSNPRIMAAYAMMIIGHIKNNRLKSIDRDINLLIKFNKKDPFAYSLASYLYESELGNREKALEILMKGLKVMPGNPKLKDHHTAFQNNKSYKMDKYGEIWYQMMLDKKGISRFQNKMIRSQQKSMKVKSRIK